MIRPKVTKSHTWFDGQATPQERLDAYAHLTPSVKEALKRIGYRPGTIPTEAQMDALFADAEKQTTKELIRACVNASLRPGLAAVNEILSALRKVDFIGMPLESKVVQLADQGITFALGEAETSAYAAFRQFPSAERYSRCFAVRRAFDALEREQSKDYPSNPWPRCRLKPPMQAGPYVVVPGDSLSKISKRFYGEECLWDAIYESNGLTSHPDHIVPGQRLNIQSGW